MTTTATSALDDAYFSEYADPRTHKSMVLDDQRVLAYREAIFRCVRDKTVLDVGCGMTALLSVLSARAGARRVYAVEACAAACRFARRVVRDNGVGDVVEVVEGRIEDDDLPGLRDGDGRPVEVDVVVSEWMGACLFHEGMLPSVLRARDRHLRPGGRMLPDRATLFLAPIEDRVTWDGQVGTWSSGDGEGGRGVHRDLGVDLGCIAEEARRSAFDHPWSRCVRPEQLLCGGDAVAIGSWDLHALPIDALAHGTPLVARASFRFGGGGVGGGGGGRPRRRPRTLHGFAVWFDVTFGPASAQGLPLTAPSSSTSPSPAPTVTLSTGPDPKRKTRGCRMPKIRAPDPADGALRGDAGGNGGDKSSTLGSSNDYVRNDNATEPVVFGGKPTNHWGQTVFYVEDPLAFDEHSQELRGTISVAPRLSPAQQRERRHRDDDSQRGRDAVGDHSWRFLSVDLTWGTVDCNRGSDDGDGDGMRAASSRVRGANPRRARDGNDGARAKRARTSGGGSDVGGDVGGDYTASFTTARIEYAEPCAVYPEDRSPE